MPENRCGSEAPFAEALLPNPFRAGAEISKNEQRQVAGGRQQSAKLNLLPEREKLCS